MAYVNQAELEHKNISLVYIAGNTSEAKEIENILTEEELIYTLKPTPFLRHMALQGPMELPGVGFYVLSGQAKFCRDLLLSSGFKLGLVNEGEE